MALDKELLAILACPKCKSSVTLSEDGNWLGCKACRLRYEVRDGIPIMLLDEAKPLDE